MLFVFTILTKDKSFQRNDEQNYYHYQHKQTALASLENFFFSRIKAHVESVHDFPHFLLWQWRKICRILWNRLL